MKHLLFILLIIFCGNSLSAQSLLPMNEQGKISFAEIVIVDSLKKGQLYANVKAWLLSKKFDVVTSTVDSLAGKLTAQQSIPVYARGYLSKKIHGTITYTAVIEVKDGKYRYSMGNFVYHYHKEDRNYTMVPTGKTKALEEEKASGWQSLWENHKRYTNQILTKNIAQLKTSMLQMPAVRRESPVAAKKENIEW